MKQFETTMSSKGQIVISKDIREALGLKPGQKILEERKGNEIIVKPVMQISRAKGILKGIDTRPTKEIMEEVRKGWK